MGIRKELTLKEQVLIRMLEMDKKYTYDYSARKEKIVARTPSDMRRLLKTRKDHRLYDGWKKLVDKILGEKFETIDEFSKASRQYEELMKYQGYLIKDYCVAEWSADKMSEAQMKKWLILEAV
jgi:hypothetical protein